VLALKKDIHINVEQVSHREEYFMEYVDHQGGDNFSSEGADDVIA
jgi:hypothetical protein